MLSTARRWIRRRRARRLRGLARSRPPETLDGEVSTLRDLAATGDDQTAAVALDGLTALARGSDPSSIRERATDALVDALAEGDGSSAATARSLRYVALERGGVAERLDTPFAAVLERWSDPAHRPVAVDAGALVGTGHGEDLPETRRALREALLGGTDRARENAAVAYVLAADDPGGVEDPGTVAEQLAIIDADRDDPFPAPGTTARLLAGDRTLPDAVAAFDAAATGE